MEQVGSIQMISEPDSISRCVVHGRIRPIPSLTRSKSAHGGNMARTNRDFSKAFKMVEEVGTNQITHRLRRVLLDEHVSSLSWEVCDALQYYIEWRWPTKKFISKIQL